MKAEPPVQYTARYNIAPSQPVLLLRRNASTGSREFAHALWGFLPSWTDGKTEKPLINARSETVFEKPSFRNAALAYRLGRFCLSKSRTGSSAARGPLARTNASSISSLR